MPLSYMLLYVLQELPVLHHLLRHLLSLRLDARALAIARACHASPTWSVRARPRTRRTPDTADCCCATLAGSLHTRRGCGGAVVEATPCRTGVLSHALIVVRIPSIPYHPAGMAPGTREE